MKENSLKKLAPDFDFLNEKFSINLYTELGDEKRIQFRLELKQTIKNLQKYYLLKWMTKDDLVTKGRNDGNKIAEAIATLEEWSNTYNYDRTFHIRESISDLRKHLFEELFGGKKIFYDLNKLTVALDPNYIPFILGEKFKIEL